MAAEPPIPPGADLQVPTPDLLLAAYARGVFPMADPRTGRLDWFSPDPRAVLPLESFHVPRGLARVVRRAPFRIRSDADFEAVVRACGPERGDAAETWIDERLLRTYVDLHARGNAHSVEAWREGRLVGGLYGVHLGAAFFGESMFVRPAAGGTDASKVCLVHLVRHLVGRGFTLLDVQFENEHLRRFGCVAIRRAAYLRRLAAAIGRPAAWEPFDGAP